MHRRCILHRLTDTVVHHLLTVAVIGETAVCAVVRISPSLVIAIYGVRIRLKTLRILYQTRQIRLKCRSKTRLLTHLLESNVIPRFIGNDVGKSRTRRIGAHSVLYLTVLEGIVGLGNINPMRMESLTAAIGIADNHLHASLLCKFPKILLHSILREAIPYSQHTHDAVLRQKPLPHGGRKFRLRLNTKATTNKQYPINESLHYSLLFSPPSLRGS